MRVSQERTIHLPFAFGDMVYHRARSERVRGMVTGFHARPTSLLIAVT
jgi:hypothetical protein